MSKIKRAGTCQACFRNHSMTAAERLVHHGYERPGVGYIVGDCAGVGHEPYELSCELSKSWKASVEKTLAGLITEQEALQADKVESLDVTTREQTSRREKPAGEGWRAIEKKSWGTVGWYRLHRFTVSRDHVPSKERNEAEASEWTSFKGHDFEYYRQQRITKLQGWIQEAQADLRELTRRIEEWVYAPEKLKAYQGSKKAEVVHYAPADKPYRAACVMSYSIRGSGNRTCTSETDKVTCTRCRARRARRLSALQK